jgi:hypothetical protein
MVGSLKFEGVKVLGFHKGLLRFQQPNGMAVRRAVGDITEIRVSDPPEYETAVRLMAATSFERAAAAFERAHRRTDEQWLKDWIRLQILICFAQLDDFERSVKAYVEAARAFPRQISQIARLKAAKKGSTANERGLAILRDAIRSPLAEAVRPAIEDLYFSILKIEDPESYERLAKDTAAALNTTGTAPLKTSSKELKAIVGLIEKGNTERAIARLNRFLPRASSRQVGAAYLFRAEAFMASGDLLAAGLDFMKAALCCDERDVQARGFYGAGVVYGRLGRDSKSAVLRAKARELGYDRPSSESRWAGSDAATEEGRIVESKEQR